MRTNTRHEGEGGRDSESRRRQPAAGQVSRGALAERGEATAGEVGQGDVAGKRVGAGGGEHALVRGERDGRAPRVEQPRLLDRRRDPRLLPLGQARAPAPEGAGGEDLPSPLPLRYSGLRHQWGLNLVRMWNCCLSVIDLAASSRFRPSELLNPAALALGAGRFWLTGKYALDYWKVVAAGVGFGAYCACFSPKSNHEDLMGARVNWPWTVDTVGSCE